ncbi:hypothetical protein [Natronorubrum bangense]|uniref:Uncharacterized protein n=1 Tax=Natronorubrum bangense JCM 10635 TaxID=1227500 RepID=L9WEV4_9EURY|nr:hypothetical protein [Natronorubrum bangense]ELY47816.1 hypothetical protein C494_11460 [Natronorubrum bangense JCM 10635]
MKYCLNCDWQASATDDSDRSPSRKAIDHHVETGHTIDSSDGVIPLTIVDEPAISLVRE